MLKLLTVKEAAALLRITPHSVYRMARTGAVPRVRIGRQVRFDEAALEAWIAAQASAASTNGEETMSKSTFGSGREGMWPTEGQKAEERNEGH